jgi:hypothetical protein
LENLKETDHSEDPDLDGRSLKKYGQKVRVGFIWLRIGAVRRML